MSRLRRCLSSPVIVTIWIFGSCALCLDAGAAALSNSHYSVTFHTERPGWNSVQAGQAKAGSTHMQRPLFSVSVRDAVPGQPARERRIRSDEFVTRACHIRRDGPRSALDWSLRWQDGTLRLDVRLEALADSSPEIVWKASLTANRDLNLEFTFPLIDGLELSSRPADVWYMHPRWAGIINDVPANIASVYGQYVRMQAMAAHAVNANGRTVSGMYIITRDTTMARKTFELVKREPGRAPVIQRDAYGFPFADAFRASTGVGMAVSWLRVALRAGVRYDIPPVVTAFGAVGWRDAVQSYARWVRTWMPEHQRAARDCYHHASFYTLFDQPDCDSALAYLDRHVRADYLQYMVQKQHRNGEYGYREDWGLPELQRFTQALKQRGIHTNHYIEGYIVHEQSPVWLENRERWGQMIGGAYQTAFANMCMWLAEPGWHRWLTDTAVRLASELKLDSIYLDEVGFGTGDKTASDNPNHRPGRFQPDGAMTGVRGMLRTVRVGLDKVDPAITLYTEGPAVDCLLPWLDGVEDYGCRQWSLPIYRIPIHLMRFVFPDVTFADIPEGNPEEVDTQIRMCLFNGIGFMTGLLERTEPEGWAACAGRVLRENRDALRDMHPTPLAPTRMAGVYSNHFQAQQKLLVTAFNANGYRAAGQLLNLPQGPADIHWVDVIRCAEAVTEQSATGLRAVLDLPPSGVAALARLPVSMTLFRTGEHVTLSIKDPQAADVFELVELTRNGELLRQSPFPLTDSGFSLASLSQQGQLRLAVKRLRSGMLIDLLELPDLPALDLAQDAAITASVRPEQIDRVLQRAPGSFSFRWDDTERWMQLSWPMPQTFNASHLRCSQPEYSPRKYSYHVSDDGHHWREIHTVDRMDSPLFDAVDQLPLTTAKYLRLVIHQGGPWADASDFVRWRIQCLPMQNQMRSH